MLFYTLGFGACCKSRSRLERLDGNAKQNGLNCWKTNAAVSSCFESHLVASFQTQYVKVGVIPCGEMLQSVQRPDANISERGQSGAPACGEKWINAGGTLTFHVHWSRRDADVSETRQATSRVAPCNTPPTCMPSCSFACTVYAALVLAWHRVLL